MREESSRMSSKAMFCGNNADFFVVFDANPHVLPQTTTADVVFI